MRSQRLQPAGLEKLRQAIAAETPDLEGEIATFFESKPTFRQVEDFVRAKSLEEKPQVQKEVAKLREPADLKEGVRELSADELAEFRAELERAAAPKPASDFADDLKQSAHL